MVNPSVQPAQLYRITNLENHPERPAMLVTEVAGITIMKVFKRYTIDVNLNDIESDSPSDLTETDSETGEKNRYAVRANRRAALKKQAAKIDAELNKPETSSDSDSDSSDSEFYDFDTDPDYDPDNDKWLMQKGISMKVRKRRIAYSKYQCLKKEEAERNMQTDVQILASIRARKNKKQVVESSDSESDAPVTRRSKPKGKPVKKGARK